MSLNLTKKKRVINFNISIYGKLKLLDFLFRGFHCIKCHSRYSYLFSLSSVLYLFLLLKYYCQQVQLYPDLHSHGAKMTQIVAGTRDPDFNEIFAFRMREKELGNTKLIAQVCTSLFYVHKFIKFDLT